MVPVAEVLGQSLEVVHVFGEVFGDVRLQDLKNAALAPPGVGIAPGEAQHRADTSLLEYLGCDSYGEGLDSRTQRLVNNGADIFRLDVANSVFQLGQRIAQSRVEMLVSRDDLTQFLQAWHF